MLEKTGEIRLNEDDIKQAKEGKVSDRVKDTWNLTVDELQGLVKAGEFKSDKDYETSTQEAHDKFVKERNKSLIKNQ